MLIDINPNIPIDAPDDVSESDDIYDNILYYVSVLTAHNQIMKKNHVMVVLLVNVNVQ